ncbi:MAG: nucleotidyltransferase family protein [Roseburia sp.]|nr:nucleotidyltransferase family protein [Roseburia sp.]
MKIIGIIAEYNPFHNGHAYQIEEIRRRTGADYIVAAMSGDFVQRGAPAVVDKYARARMALSCGADLVLELPVLWATASAESFAAAGVALFEKMGCVDGICFGAECDNLSLLSEIADILAEEPSAYRAALSSYIKEGLTFPQARARALTEVLANSGQTSQENISASEDALTQPASLTHSELTEILGSPNNILAIEYLKAIRRQDSSLTPYLIKREGAGYHDAEIHDDSYIFQDNTDACHHPTNIGIPVAVPSPALIPVSAPAASATAIRGALSAATSASLSAKLAAAMPAPALSVLTDYLSETPAVWSDDFSPILGYLLLSVTPEELALCGDCNTDIANRLFKNRFSYRSVSQFCEQNKSRDITYTRMSRILLHLLLRIRNTDYAAGKAQGYIPYLRILGFCMDSSALLGELKRRAAVPVISKLADAKKMLVEDAASLLDLDIFAADLYEQIASQKKGTTPRSEYTREIVRI